MSISEHIGEFALGAVVAVMGYFGKRELARIDAKANQSDLDEMLARFDEHIDDHKDLRLELTERLDKVADASIETAKAVARIEGLLAQR